MIGMVLELARLRWRMWRWRHGLGHPPYREVPCPDEPDCGWKHYERVP